MPTNTRERGLEDLIVDHLVTTNDYEQGTSNDYNKASGIDEGRLLRYLTITQQDKLSPYHLLDDDKKRSQLISRIQGEIEKHGTTAVLRNGIQIYPAGHIDLYSALPSENNITAEQNFRNNIFSVTRQFHYSARDPALSLDLCIFLNGLPIITCELKNTLTRQTYEDAIYQYRHDRDPRELLFHFGRTIVNFAVDDNEIHMCTEINGKTSQFLPFNKGYNDGSGNPPNPDGIKTDYLWKDILTKPELADIIENYTQILETKDPDTKKTKRTQIFPRYHQLSVVRNLLTHAKTHGPGQRYLIQHSAGSGKSNSIAWLALQLVSLQNNGKTIFDSIVVVTDRINLDKQIKGTIKNFAQIQSLLAHAESAADLRTYIQSGKKIIITTVHKFPIILQNIGVEHTDHNFAILIDEAHSSQSGRMSAAMNILLSQDTNPAADGEEPDLEDQINAIVEHRKMLPNASYFAFTATPKNKTLEIFGVPYQGSDGKTKHKPFHTYTMKQAIQERFILDVLLNYTPVKSYYKLVKTIENDPVFDKKKAQKKLQALVERDKYPISQKAEIIVEHFHTQVIAPGKIQGKARAMVVCRDIETAITYYHAISAALRQRKSQYKAIIAFSGEKNIDGHPVTEATLNGFPSSQIEKTFKQEPYRFLVVANKFQTGYDEPLLHTMYVDKPLSDVKAVQTLSRLNRSYPGKYDTFILDFFNDSKIIKEAFDKYYKTTILADETDPNKLYDLLQEINDAEIFTREQMEKTIRIYLTETNRTLLDPELDICAVTYQEKLDLDAQIKFKSAVKSYVRTYGFLAAILPFGNPDWEKYSIFLNLLLPNLPTPQDEDLAKGILSAVDLESYRAEALATIRIQLEDQDAEINPVPTKDPTGRQEPELDTLSNILATFHDLWGNIEWHDEDRIKRQIADLPARVAENEAYQIAMKNSDKENARLESEKALKKVLNSIMADHLELYKQFSDNPSFRKWLESMVFNTTYKPTAGET